MLSISIIQIPVAGGMIIKSSFFPFTFLLAPNSLLAFLTGPVHQANVFSELFIMILQLLSWDMLSLADLLISKSEEM